MNVYCEHNKNYVFIIMNIGKPQTMKNVYCKHNMSRHSINLMSYKISTSNAKNKQNYIETKETNKQDKS